MLVSSGWTTGRLSTRSSTLGVQNCFVIEDPQRSSLAQHAIDSCQIAGCSVLASAYDETDGRSPGGVTQAGNDDQLRADRRGRWPGDLLEDMDLITRDGAELLIRESDRLRTSKPR